MTTTKPILCLDFDGVCHSYTTPWSGATVIPDQPVPGLFEFLRAAGEHFEIMVYSSRSNQEGGVVAMQLWFQKHAPIGADVGPGKVHIYGGAGTNILFPTEKPAAFLTLDDRALTFTGRWPKVQSLLRFKPWNKKVRRW